MIWDSFKKPFFVLAPMNEVTDSVFRQVIDSCARPDVYFTEFISVDILASTDKELMSNKLYFTNIEKPLIVQLWGIHPENFLLETKILVEKGFAGVDLNMGCPVAKIIKNGACSSLINDRKLAKEIIDATKNGAGDTPLSIKTRIGYDNIDLSWIEFLLQQNIDCITVHARTVIEKSNVPNHFEVLPEILDMRNRISPNTKIILNGDVTSRQHGCDLANKYAVDGIMVGRAIFDDPYFFSRQSNWNAYTPEQKISLYLKHVELFDQTWENSKNPDVLKKYAQIYISDFEHAQEVRNAVMREVNISGMKKIIQSFI
ncbi:MAG: tRNA-dihydrouridine synthase family protein [Acidimicrobiia bacterium]|mgnify:CR=1 FL=1|nr:tRNA-dihydrouridine synthase family protein [Acidimicrobiia bacterium]